MNGNLNRREGEWKKQQVSGSVLTLTVLFIKLAERGKAMRESGLWRESEESIHYGI